MTIPSELLPAARQFLIKHSRAEFSVFQRYAHGLVSGEPFINSIHSRAIANALEQVAHGKVRRICIAVPPRHHKSYIASVAAPAYLLGKDPRLRIICASYGNDLSGRLGSQFRDIVQSPLYRQIFPQTKLSSKIPPLHDIRTTRNGYRLSTSIGGVITGIGADVAIIDDPMKAADASSQAVRDAVGEWFKGSLMSRFDRPAEARVVVVMQRLHQDDLIGRLKAEGGWTVLELPAETLNRYELRLSATETRMMEPGDLLFAERFPKEELDKLRVTLGEAQYHAQMLQRPTPAGGHLFNLTHAKRFELPQKVKPSGYDGVLVSVDCASSVSSSADYTAFTVWGIRGRELYLLYARRGRWTLTQTMNALGTFVPTSGWPGRGTLIESGGSGFPLAQALRERGCPNIWEWAPKKDKTTRADLANLRMEQGMVHLPIAAPWLDEFENELAEFPHGKNDDYVDSFSQVTWNLEGKLAQMLHLKSFPTPKAA